MTVPAGQGSRGLVRLPVRPPAQLAARSRSARTCQACGTPVLTVSRAWDVTTINPWRFRHAYCSEECRDELAAERNRARHRVGLTEHTCARCGQAFSARRDARYCSAHCRVAAHREARRA